MSRLAEGTCDLEQCVVWICKTAGLILLREFHAATKEKPRCRGTGESEIWARDWQPEHLLIVMKGLPLAYSKDMQEDKEPVFETSDVRAMSFSNDRHDDRYTLRFRQDGRSGWSWTVKCNGPCGLASSSLRQTFREAHHITGPS